MLTSCSSRDLSSIAKAVPHWILLWSGILSGMVIPVWTWRLLNFSICTLDAWIYGTSAQSIERDKTWLTLIANVRIVAITSKPPFEIQLEGRARSYSCYDKHALRADAPIPRMFFLSSCTMTLLYLCSTDTDTIIPLRPPPPVSPPVWPLSLFYLHTIPCSLVPDTSHLLFTNMVRP